MTRDAEKGRPTLEDVDPRIKEAFEASYKKNREALEELAKL